jgi:dUTP pyrophosphatase
MEKVTKTEIEKATSLLESIVGEKEEQSSLADIIGTLLLMSDEDLSLIGPGIIQSLAQTMNLPNQKLALVSSLNATGTKSEDIIISFAEVIENIEQIPDLSQVKKDFVRTLGATITNAINETEGISKRIIEIPIELCHPDAKIPQYANISDSGLDVYALDDYTINPGETKLIPTGIKLAIPPGYEIQVRPKSGRALKTKLRIANTPGTVDAGYRDEIKVIVENIETPIQDIDYEFDENGKIIINSILHGSSHTIGKGEKFCQLVLMEVPKANFFRVEKVGEIGENRGGGFGSTGLK